MTNGFKYFAILGAMRTGSNLLERNLAQFDRISCHGELFNPSFVGKAGRDQSFGITLAQRERNPVNLLRAMWTDDAETLPGFRYFEGHDPRIMDLVISDKSCAKIILTRDGLDSYVSLKIARATNQWMLGNVKKRKSATIRFDMGEYQAFLTDRNQFYSDVRSRLQAAGQAAFEVSYDDLQSREVINGIAAYLGADQVLDELEEPIKRQNPEPLSVKVENFDEMRSQLATTGEIRDQTPQPARTGSARVKTFIVSQNRPMLFAPVPGYPVQHVQEWMMEHGQIARNLTRGDLTDWLEKNPDISAFSIVEHPVARAYRALIERIQTDGPKQLPNISTRLAAHHDVASPGQGKEMTADEQKCAFLAFLAFLKSNLASQTSIRIDGSWQAQDHQIANIAELQPLTRVLRAEDFPQCDEFLGLGAPGLPCPIPLHDIYCDEIERKARQVYGRDYRKFGYRDWNAYAA